MEHIIFGNQPTCQPGGGMPSMFILVLFFLAFWFLLIAPQRKKQKEQEKMISNLKTGDVIMTSSGIIGTITNIKQDRLILKTAETKVEVHKSFVQSKLGDEKSDQKDKK